MKTQLPAQQQSPSGNSLLFGSPTVEEGQQQDKPQHRESVDVLPPEELERCFVFGYN